MHCGSLARYGKLKEAKAVILKIVIFQIVGFGVLFLQLVEFMKIKLWEYTVQRLLDWNMIILGIILCWVIYRQVLDNGMELKK